MNQKTLWIIIAIFIAVDISFGIVFFFFYVRQPVKPPAEESSVQTIDEPEEQSGTLGDRATNLLDQEVTPPHPPIDIDQLGPNQTDRGLESYIQQTQTGIQYTNNRYRFRFIVPSEWAPLNEEVVEEWAGAEILYSVRLTDWQEPDHYVQIQVVDRNKRNEPSVIDFPHVYLAENTQYVFFVQSGAMFAGMPGESTDAEALEAELNAILKTFELF